AMGYFGCLGVGFMVIELGLIHKFTVLLGYPAYSFITVVTTLLLSSGLGSWLSGGRRLLGSRAALCLVLTLVAAGVAGGAWAFQHVHLLRTLDIPWRTFCVAALIAPL